MKKLTSLLICTLLLGSLSSASTYAASPDKLDDAPIPPENTAEETLEGEGWDTPEEAVTAYVNGLMNNDIDEMLSAFAIETYADHYSLAKQVDRMKMYNSSTMKYVPGSSPFARQINIETRREEAMISIRNHYMALVNPDFLMNGSSGMAITLEPEQTGEELVSELLTADDASSLTGLTFKQEFTDPEQLSDKYGSENMQKNLSAIAASINADEIRGTVTRFYRGGETFVLLQDCVRYGDKWFLYNSQGSVASLLGINVFYSGLLPLGEYGFDEFLSSVQ